MLISPELLNIHSHATWQQEFNLSEQQIEKLAFKVTNPILAILGLQNMHLCLFSDRSPCYVNAGRAAATDPVVFANLRTLILSEQKFILLNDNSNNRYFKQLKTEDEHIDIDIDIDHCLLIKIVDKQEKIKGHCCFYGTNTEFNKLPIDAISQLLIDGLTSALTSQKYRRLNQDREEFNELVANANLHPIFAKDIDSKIVFANQAFINLYPAEQSNRIIGYTTVEEYDKEQRDIFLADDKETFAHGQKTVVETIDFPNGEQRTLETTKKRFKTRDGKDYICGVSYDLSKEYQLINLLKKKNHDLDYVANMLATDVRAPANAMVKLIAWLEEDLANINNPEITDNLHEIGTRAKKINKLLTAIYHYCFAGRDKHITTLVSLTTLVSDMLSHKPINKKVESNIDDLNLNVPRMPFTTVLKAIIDNAVEHNNHEIIKIDISCTQDKTNYYLSVADNGVGIESTMRDSVFNLFETTKTVSDDNTAGVGLAIARKIIDSYGGRIYIANNSQTDSNSANLQGHSVSSTSGITMNIVWPKPISKSS